MKKTSILWMMGVIEMAKQVPNITIRPDMNNYWVRVQGRELQHLNRHNVCIWYNWLTPKSMI